MADPKATPQEIEAADRDETPPVPDLESEASRDGGSSAEGLEGLNTLT